MKSGLPICNIRRDDRLAYYEALSFADVSLFEPLVELVRQRCADLFGEYTRLRNESRRMVEWAERWGTREAEVQLRRESREMDLWQSRMRQVLLEFQQAADLLGDSLEEININFHEYGTELDVEKYQQLKERGSAERCNFFSITFVHTRTGVRERFMFRYFRNRSNFEPKSRAIPLELNYFNSEEERYIRTSNHNIGAQVHIRELYFTDDGEFIMRRFDPEIEDVAEKFCTIMEAREMFFNEVLRNVWGLR
jgi:hypothetical protein